MSDSDEQLFKILVGAAWIDGEIQPQEREYLQKIAVSRNLTNNSEVDDLLSFNQLIPPEQCYQWLGNYLDNNPTKENCHNLISEIAALVYCDDNIDTEEAKLLNQIENYSSPISASNQILPKILQTIGKIYRKSIKSLN